MVKLLQQFSTVADASRPSFRMVSSLPSADALPVGHISLCGKDCQCLKLASHVSVTFGSGYETRTSCANCMNNRLDVRCGFAPHINIIGMDYNFQQVPIHCRVCGQKLTKYRAKKRTSSECITFSAELKLNSF